MSEEDKAKNQEEQNQEQQPLDTPKSSSQQLNREQLEALRNKLQQKFH